MTKSSNWIPVIGHPLDRAPITWQTSHDQEFCNIYKYFVLIGCHQRVLSLDSEDDFYPGYWNISHQQ